MVLATRSAAARFSCRMYSILRKKPSAAAGWPAKLHVLAKHLIDTSADLFVSQELLSVELLEASGNLPAEPCVMIDVMFHKLFDVLLRAALVLGSGSVHFRLQFGRKLHFHIFPD